MTKLIGLLALLALILYGVFEVFPLLQGPAILLTSPVEGQTFGEHTLVLAGVAEHTETLLLNGTILPIDGQGRFSKTLTLPSGGAILSLTATDRFGKQETLERSVLISE